MMIVSGLHVRRRKEEDEGAQQEEREPLHLCRRRSLSLGAVRARVAAARRDRDVNVLDAARAMVVGGWFDVLCQFGSWRGRRKKREREREMGAMVGGADKLFFAHKKHAKATRSRPTKSQARVPFLPALRHGHRLSRSIHTHTHILLSSNHTHYTHYAHYTYSHCTYSHCTYSHPTPTPTRAHKWCAARPTFSST